jgi:uncharacterized protein with NAD-binding domain and iron-sulfur cluster
MSQQNGSGENNRTKVAILGGGPGGLTAAYYLTTLEPGKYDITVYEMSWRLGGKTASGRDASGRIEEHGLHVLFGGYHNAFDMMLGCYDALAKAEGAAHLPFPEFFDALVPADFGVIGDERFKKWRQWDLQFPVNRGVPGDPPLPTTMELASTILQVLIHCLLGGSFLRSVQYALGRTIGRSRRLSRQGRRQARETPGDGGDWFVRRVLIPGCLHILDRKNLIGRICLLGARAFHWFVRRSAVLVRADFILASLIGRAWTALDLMSATFVGLSEDRVLSTPDGLHRIDALDLREWLAKHGASRHTRRSPLVRIIYDAAFSYPEGGRQPGPAASTKRSSLRQSVAAGAALRIILWMALTYKGAMYFKMKAGMGEIIHVPLYHLLKRRGVSFKFFHRVTRLRPGTDDGHPVIDEIELQQTATPANGASYDPLIRVNDFECWPDKPIAERVDPDDYDDALHAEEFFHRPRHPRVVRLSRRGRLSTSGAVGGASVVDEFDKVIFAIPVACAPYLCEELARDPRNRWSLQGHIGTTQTVALQLWSKYSLAELGWRDPPPLLSLFWDPLNTWCDMSQVLAREAWPTESRPVMTAYFCGPFPHEWIAAERERIFPEVDERWREQIARQLAGAENTLFAHLAELWPSFGTPLESGHKQVQNWNIVFDPANRAGAGRRQALYSRANFDPHQRCTLALPGETENRISADDTGYANLAVAGDWIANEVFVACFEGTVQGGLRAARATSEDKSRYRIIGERLLNPGRGGRSGSPRPPGVEPLPHPERERRAPPLDGDPPAAAAAERSKGSVQEHGAEPDHQHANDLPQSA